MKIALLSPAGAMHRYNGLFAKSLHYAPITLSLLAALVPPELNAEITIYDESAEPIPLDLEADIIGITCITGTSTRVYRFADYFRSRGMTVVLGGPHPSLCPDEAKAHADAVVVGLGDHSWPRLLRDFFNGDLQPFYRSEACENIANRPLPRRDLLNKKRYITLNTVEAVRGCHLNCSFCAYPKAFGRHVVTRPVKDVIAEIKTLHGKEIIFPDVNLLSDIDYLKELLTAMIPLKKWWFGLTTSDIVLNDDIVKLFERSGCKGLLIGFESVNAASQIEMHKGVNKPAAYKTLMDILHKHGIMVMGCFAFGADEDGSDVFERTVRLADEIQIDLPRYAIFTPFPKTDYHNQLENEGRIVENNWALYDVEHCVFKPKQMTKEMLEEGIHRAWSASYSFKSIMKRWRWQNPKIFFLGWFFFFVNLGYRTYAKKFKIFNADMMADNSDIPESGSEHMHN
jgi:radical SAM superfamily enzyme YgiQ (UPF0313 family)